MKQVSSWGCSYCAMTSRRKGSVKRHEVKYCRKNPNRVTCDGCEHMVYSPTWCEGGDYGQTYYHDAQWYCEAKGMDLVGVEINNNIECDQFKRRKI